VNAVELLLVVPLLSVNASRVGEQFFEFLGRLGQFALDITQHSPQIVAQLLGLLLRSPDLARPGIAALIVESLLANSFVALAQLNFGLLRFANHCRAGFLVKPSICRESDRLLLYGRVDVDALDVFRIEGLSARRSRENLFEHLLDAVGFDPLSPFDQARRMARQFVLKVFVAAEVLPVGILNPLLNDCFVALVVGVFEVVQPDQQSRRRSGPPHLFRVEGAELLLEVVPVNLLREPEQGMLRIELLIEARLKKVLLWALGLTISRFHSFSPRFARFLRLPCNFTRCDS
jgi:hypothetical protein